MTQRLQVPDSVGPGVWLRICSYKFPGDAGGKYREVIVPAF